MVSYYSSNTNKEQSFHDKQSDVTVLVDEYDL